MFELLAAQVSPAWIASYQLVNGVVFMRSSKDDDVDISVPGLRGLFFVPFAHTDGRSRGWHFSL